MEKELGKDFFKCKDVVKLIESNGLIRTVTDFCPFYEGLVKEFMVNVSVGCDDANNKDYRKVEEGMW